MGWVKQDPVQRYSAEQIVATAYSITLDGDGGSNSGNNLQTNGGTGYDTNDCVTGSGAGNVSWKGQGSEQGNIYLSHEGNGNGVCMLPMWTFDLTAIPDTATITGATMYYDIDQTNSITSITGFDWLQIDAEAGVGGATAVYQAHNEVGEGVIFGSVPYADVCV
jgi:hypothetical protein